MISSLEEKFNRAQLLEKEGQVSQALQEYEAIIDEDNRFKEAYLNLGSLYSRLDRLDDSMKWYQKALKLGEDHIIHFNIGSIHYRRGEFKKAVLALDRSRRINRDFPLSTLVMGLCFSRLRNIKAAEICFTDVLAVWPDNLAALTAMAIICYESRRYDEALTLINKIIILNSRDNRIRKLRANTLYQMNRVNEFTSEIKFIKSFSDGYANYDDFIKSIPVEIYTDKYGSINEKIRSLREKARDKSDTRSLVSLSLCHLLKGDTEIAIDYLLEARKRNLN